MVKNLATTAFAPFRGGVEPTSSKGFWIFLYKTVRVSFFYEACCFVVVPKAQQHIGLWVSLSLRGTQ